MIFLFRLIIVVLLGGLISICGIFFCLFNPRNSKNVARFAHLFGAVLNPFLGVKIIIRENKKIQGLTSCIYIANHQDNFDVIFAGKIVQPKTVTVGKKSLVWIPLFGQLYWLAGNILIDRENKAKARETIEFVVKQIKQRKVSIWMFPEGTRSKGRGLLPFKSGAFRTAIAAGVPIVPICVSNTSKISLNRFKNGHIIVEMLDPIDTSSMNKTDAKELMIHCHNLMLDKINQLNSEVSKLNLSK
ncbi:1-acylglycerol-3-phosphate O-acyltransferase [Orbaceae bacterium ac157xtp]